MDKFDIDFYETLDGRCPVVEFIESLDTKMKAKVLRTIDLLADNGIYLRGPYSESLGNGIYELRIKQGSDITRVLYFFLIGRKAILTNGFVKKSQKTPPEAIALAEKYREDYERRH